MQPKQCQRQGRQFRTLRLYAQAKEALTCRDLPSRYIETSPWAKRNVTWRLDEQRDCAEDRNENIDGDNYFISVQDIEV